MEDLEARLALGFCVSTEANNPISIHPRFNNYKYNAKFSETQEERRRRVLESSKARRAEVVNELRKLTDVVHQIKNEGKKKKIIGDHLMLSEWMVEVPDDLEENYFMVVCPVGKRSLVVASRGSTKSYDLSGALACEFKSPLDGGNPESYAKTTVLDCIYDATSRTYYVLDMICYCGHHVHECETEFRWYWLETKFREEMPDALKKSKGSRRSFDLAPRFECKKSAFERVFSEKMDFEVDGILFYHKSHPYVFGFSPITTWLKPYMLPEVIGTAVNECYLANVPSWYGGFSNHCKNVQEKAERRNKKSDRRFGRNKDGDVKAKEESAADAMGTDAADAIGTDAADAMGIDAVD